MEHAVAWSFRSAVPGVTWPAVPDPRTAVESALLFQVGQTEWLPPAALETSQLTQLATLLRHAAAHVEFYAERIDPAAGLARRGALTMEAFKRLPILTRREVQQGFEALQSRATPAEHGKLFELRSSGSTGMPVKVVKTALANVYWNVFSMRDHVWYGRDLGAKLCVMRKGPSGLFDNWGGATAMIDTGKSARIDVSVDYDTALRWLQDEQPVYLQTYPSVVAALASDALAAGVSLPSLREVRTFGEPLDPGVEALCAQAWGVTVSSSYSCEEVGYLALRCPTHGHYHCMDEGALVEVLHPDGRDCQPGERGRVVVTPLHNFAMPLIRYEVGDYAEVGPPCPCGRGLKVLSRVLGRVRNTLVCADGRRFWPVFGLRSNPTVALIEQHQVVQTTLSAVELRYVSARPLDAAAEGVLAEGVQAQLPGGFSVAVRRVDAIERSPSGKFEDFKSEVSV